MVKFTVNTLAASDGTALCKSATSSYPNVYKFNSNIFEISSIQDLYKVITATAKHKMCLLKGALNKELHEEPRAGSTDSDTPTQWVCLDLDGIALESVEAFIAILPTPFRDVSYVLQESASLNSKPGLRYHIFMVLNELVQPAILKSILKSLNATIPELHDTIELGRGDGNILKFPLDITTCQNDKLLYVAPRSDKRASKTHIVYIDKKRKTLDISKIQFSPAADSTTLNKLRARLRRDRGLPRKQFSVKIVDGKDLLANVDEAVLEEIKTDNGFIRFNLRGSQSKSFRYYHPVDSFEYIHSFGDEDTIYATKDFFPEYYKQCVSNKKALTRKKLHTGKQHLAVLDEYTDQYYVTTINEGEVESLRVVGSIRKAADFIVEHGEERPDYIPTWRVACDFQTDVQFDRADKFINKYRPSEYLLNVEYSDKPPGLIDTVICHMLNYDTDIIEHFYNWLAVMLQHGIRTQTAWLMHGTTGTGKGILCDYVLRPIIGPAYTNKVRLSDFAGRFNEFMSDNLLLFINEAHMSAMDQRKAHTVISNIKDCITDDMVRVEGKGRTTIDAYNNCNLLFSSNQNDPIEIEANDRRFNVANRQEQPITNVLSNKQLDAIRAGKPLQEFTNYIMSREADITKARTPIKTESLKAVQEATMDTHRALAHQLKHGELDQLIFEMDVHVDYQPTELHGLGVRALGEHVLTFENIIDRLYERAVSNKKTNISRSELIVIFHAVLSYRPDSIRKFSAHLNRKGIKMKNIKIDGEQQQGFGPVQFTVSEEAKQMYTRHKQRTSKLKRVK